jgi:hypothetical protein
MNTQPIFPSVLSFAISDALGTESPLILFPCGCSSTFDNYVENLARILADF